MYNYWWHLKNHIAKGDDIYDSKKLFIANSEELLLFQPILRDVTSQNTSSPENHYSDEIEVVGSKS